MFVYTFENIGIIKNLKHSDSIKPKHQKRISGVKDGMFADFDYSELKDDNPPKNESLKTHQELKSLQKLPEDANFVKEMDTIEDVFEKICKRNGVEWPEEEIEKVLDESSGIILDLKYHFNRPRPGILAKHYNMKLAEVILSSMKTPSYPSGHAVQGTLVGLYLAEKYDRAKLRTEFINAGKDIAKSRLIARAHYPSDRDFGEKIGKKLFQYIKSDIENKIWYDFGYFLILIYKYNPIK